MSLDKTLLTLTALRDGFYGQALISKATVFSLTISRPISLLGRWKMGQDVNYMVSGLLHHATLTGCCGQWWLFKIRGLRQNPN